MRLTYKGLVLAAAVCTLLLTLPALALAAGYNNPLQYTDTNLYPQGPHGGYTTATNKCKECHAVHLATGTYDLTRVDSPSAACDFCHGIGGVAITVTLNENGHGLTTTQTASAAITAPDDNLPAYAVDPAKWGCEACHSVHNAQTVKLAGLSTSKLLKADPNPGKTYLYYSPSLVNTSTGETTQTESQWCSTCHNANFGLHTDPKQVTDIYVSTTTAYSHDVSGTGYTTDTAGYAVVNANDGQNNGPTCKQCHVADGGTFPHSGSATSMLRSGTSKTTMDNACINCHNTAALP